MSERTKITVDRPNPGKVEVDTLDGLKVIIWSGVNRWPIGRGLKFPQGRFWDTYLLCRLNVLILKKVLDTARF